MTIGRKENFDIYTYPTDVENQDGNRIVLGDTHGNVLKLMAFLIKNNAIKNTSNAYQLEYQELVSMYRKCFSERMETKDIQRFKSILENFYLTGFICKSSVLIIGDDLADRGGSDALTLLAYNHLEKREIDYTILASNHGLDFVAQFHSKGGLTGDVVSEYMIGRREGFPENYFGRSLKGLREHVMSAENGALKIDEINQMVRNNYIKHLKLLAYDFMKGGDGINLYSHAPKHPAEIVQLYNDLKLEFNDWDKEFKAGTPGEFASSIDQMNEWFQKVLASPELFNKMMQSDKSLYSFINTRYPDLQDYDDSPEMGFFCDYPVINVHGHVGVVNGYHEGAIPSWTYINLDTALGQMAPDGKHNNVGDLMSFVSEINTTYVEEESNSDDNSNESNESNETNDSSYVSADTDDSDTEVDEPNRYRPDRSLWSTEHDASDVNKDVSTDPGKKPS